MESYPKNSNTDEVVVGESLQDLKCNEVEHIPKIVAVTPMREAPLVVNVKVAHIRPQGYHDLSEWMKNPEHIYIGRKGAVFLNINEKKRRFPEKSSEFANPFTVKKNGYRCLELYEAWLREKLEKDGIEELKKLKNKVLGCWCYPNKCHGDILRKFIVGLPNY